jgi:hypothetical protein
LPKSSAQGEAQKSAFRFHCEFSLGDSDNFASQEDALVEKAREPSTTKDGQALLYIARAIAASPSRPQWSRFNLYFITFVKGQSASFG